jgi:hypothetical protein
VKAGARLVPRHPLAWGMVKWGPLPGTRDMWIFWEGPGAGLRLYARDSDKTDSIGRGIEHPTASSTYVKLADAEKAVMAFIREGLADA